MIDYAQTLNPAQYAAVTAKDGPVLVIAGAGSGKTRTIVYRLAWLAEQGVAPASMLLLTFTRKAAQEMLQRASHLLGQGLTGVQGGTFHGFAYGILRHFRPSWLEGRNFSVMDSADITSAVAHCKDTLKIGKGDRSFPKTPTIVGLFSKARNKEVALEDIVRIEAFHLLPHADALQQLFVAYEQYRRQQGLLDYDDLLFELEALLQENGSAAQVVRARYAYTMVDEYQDTNLVQARLVRLLTAPELGGSGNVMAVGDDAQSIYAFRGADVRNIRGFPDLFPGTQVVRLEENYRSTQPVLDVANALLAHAEDSFRKHLFTHKEGGEMVRLIKPVSDKSQAQLVVKRIQELLQQHVPHEIAVLFRAGFHSYQLEVALRQVGIPFRKYGGLRFADAAHVKDVASYARLCLNPLDMPAFERLAALHKGIGPKTAQKLYAAVTQADAKQKEKAFAKYHDFLEDMHFVDDLRTGQDKPVELMRRIVEHYQPQLEAQYPDDWPRRRQGLDEFVQIAMGYEDLDLFVADLALESPEEDEHAEGCITLSTVHSAKGLEWTAVLIIDLVEERFPSRHALASPEDFEEERRLMYVACTRARRHLDLYTPASVFNRGEGVSQLVNPSPFVRELPDAVYEEWVEGYGGALQRRGVVVHTPPTYTPPPAGLYRPAAQRAPQPQPAGEGVRPSLGAAASPRPLGYCTHKIFGRGKMVKFLPPDKYQVNFMGLGLKTILADFLTFEDS